MFAGAMLNLSPLRPCTTHMDQRVEAVFAPCCQLLPDTGWITIDRRVDQTLRVALLRSTQQGPSEVASIWFHTDAFKNEIWIDWLTVTSGLRCRGLGTEMIASLEKLARSSHLESIHLYPLFKARDFWLHLGYRSHHRICKALSKSILLDQP